jgi:DNA mismatch endonuclease, patch repair protein
MVDIVDQATRSRMMSGIRSKDTKPERDLREALELMGYDLTLHEGALPGRPDIVLAHEKAAILVHGCFWHRHPGCRFTTSPATRAEYWKEKFDTNVTRDSRNLDALHELGWRTAIVWECALRRAGSAGKAALEVANWLSRSDEQHVDIGDLPAPAIALSPALDA